MSESDRRFGIAAKIVADAIKSAVAISKSENTRFGHKCFQCISISIYQDQSEHKHVFQCLNNIIT